MKKVLFVATVVKTHITVFHLPYIEMFKRKGFQVDVAAKNDYYQKEDCIIPNSDTFYDIQFSRFPISLKNIFSFFRLRKIMKENNYDIVHAHTPVGGVVARLAHWSLNSKGRLIYTAHGFHFYRGAPLVNWLIYYPIEYLLSFITDDLITINVEDYNFAKKKFKKPTIHLIKGVGLKNIDEVKVFNSKDNLFIDESKINIISVGEINNNKNHRIVIESLKMLKDLSIQYIVCGEGPLLQELKDLSRSYNLDKMVSFVGYRQDVQYLLKKSDIFVFPSHREGLSLSVMEAMQAGLPLICSRIRGNTDLVDDELGGFLFDQKSSEELSLKLRKLAENKSLRNSMGEYNEMKIESYKIEQVLESMEFIYFSGDY